MSKKNRNFAPNLRNLDLSKYRNLNLSKKNYN